MFYIILTDDSSGLSPSEKVKKVVEDNIGRNNPGWFICVQPYVGLVGF